MSLLQERLEYKPFSYPWAYEAYKKQNQIHWLPEEVSLNEDIKDWKFKLNEGEKHLLTNIFRFFTQADIDVQGAYLEKHLGAFKPVEIKMMLSAFANIENIHIDGYSYLIESLRMPDSVYKDFLNIKEMRDKHEFIKEFNIDNKHNIALTLATFGAFIEGVQLFASFAILLNFQRFNKMKGMCQIVAWSVRDETLHSNSLTRLFREFIYENPEIWTPELRKDIYEACNKVVYFEDKFIDVCFSGNVIEGLEPDDVKKYIRYIADIRLEELNLQKHFHINKNPLSWLDSILNGTEHANFFEARVTEYSKGATKGSWDDVFEEKIDNTNVGYFEAKPKGGATNPQTIFDLSKI